MENGGWEVREDGWMAGVGGGGGFFSIGSKQQSVLGTSLIEISKIVKFWAKTLSFISILMITFSTIIYLYHDNFSTKIDAKKILWRWR